MLGGSNLESIDRTVPREAPENAMLDKVDLKMVEIIIQLNICFLDWNLSCGGAQADMTTFKAEKKKPIRYALQKKLRYYLGIFPKWRTPPPPPPPFGNPLFKKKFYRLFCILDP